MAKMEGHASPRRRKKDPHVGRRGIGEHGSRVRGQGQPRPPAVDQAVVVTGRALGGVRGS